MGRLLESTASKLPSGMGLVEWVALGYVALLLSASLLAASFCRIARLSGRDVENDRREVVLWGSIRIASNTGVRAGLTDPYEVGGLRRLSALRWSRPVNTPRPGAIPWCRASAGARFMQITLGLAWDGTLRLATTRQHSPGFACNRGANPDLSLTVRAPGTPGRGNVRLGLENWGC
jgi:hypothetical protein